ncbi:MAG: DinB family protein [Thermomicrobiales bacterium]
MATVANERVRQLRADAAAKAEETARFLVGLTAEQARVTTEIGWTVAATAAHLAFTTGLLAIQLKRTRRGKPIIPPNIAVNVMNYVASRKDRAAPIAQSLAKIRMHTAANLALLDGWTDTELDPHYTKPFFGATTYEEGLRYAFVGHYDEHLGQMRRALAKSSRA